MACAVVVPAAMVSAIMGSVMMASTVMTSIEMTSIVMASIVAFSSNGFVTAQNLTAGIVTEFVEGKKCAIQSPWPSCTSLFSPKTNEKVDNDDQEREANKTSSPYVPKKAASDQLAHAGHDVVRRISLSTTGITSSTAKTRQVGPRERISPIRSRAGKLKPLHDTRSSTAQTPSIYHPSPISLDRHHAAKLTRPMALSILV
jgi:hypothetical protein